MVSVRFASAVVGSWLIHLSLGTFYCWGNITPYVTSYMRSQGLDVSYADTSWALALAGFSQGGFMFFGGRLHPYLGLRGTALLGGWTLSVGTGLSFWTVQYGLRPFLVTYSLLFGAGLGLAYTAPIVCMMRWLPGRRGLASGIVVLGFGAGAFVFNFVQKAWVNPDGLQPMRELPGGTQKYFDWEDDTVAREVLDHVPSLFLVLAGIFASMQLVGSLLLFEPPQELASPQSRQEADEAGLQSQYEAQSEAGPRQYTAWEMIKTRQFWLLFFNFFFTAQAVFFVSAFEKTFGSAVVQGGISDTTLTVVAAVSSLFNGLGRIFWGFIADHSSFRIAMVCLCLMQATLLATLFLCSSTVLYFIWVCGIFLCVGGNFALFPSATATYFGEKNVGSNYGLIFFAFGFSTTWGSLLSEVLLAELNSVIALSLVVTGLVLCGGFTAMLQSPPTVTQG